MELEFTWLVFYGTFRASNAGCVTLQAGGSHRVGVGVGVLHRVTPGSPQPMEGPYSPHSVEGAYSLDRNGLRLALCGICPEGQEISGQGVASSAEAALKEW